MKQIFDNNEMTEEPYERVYSAPPPKELIFVQKFHEINRGHHFVMNKCMTGKKFKATILKKMLIRREISLYFHHNYKFM